MELDVAAAALQVDQLWRRDRVHQRAREPAQERPQLQKQLLDRGKEVGVDQVVAVLVEDVDGLERASADKVQTPFEPLLGVLQRRQLLGDGHLVK